MVWKRKERPKTVGLKTPAAEQWEWEMGFRCVPLLLVESCSSLERVFFTLQGCCPSEDLVAGTPNRMTKEDGLARGTAGVRAGWTSLLFAHKMPTAKCPRLRQKSAYTATIIT